MMANQNTFLCECGRVLGRMENSYHYLAWNAPKGEPIHRGLQCGSCGLNWTYVHDKEGRYVNVQKCCFGLKCGANC
jgi:hypothetical protein